MCGSFPVTDHFWQTAQWVNRLCLLLCSSQFIQFPSTTPPSRALLRFSLTDLVNFLLLRHNTDIHHLIKAQGQSAYNEPEPTALWVTFIKAAFGSNEGSVRGNVLLLQSHNNSNMTIVIYKKRLFPESDIFPPLLNSHPEYSADLPLLLLMLYQVSVTV